MNKDDASKYIDDDDRGMTATTAVVDEDRAVVDDGVGRW